MSTEMRVDPQRAKTLADNLSQVVQRITSANTTSRKIRLIAVSKLKPATDILALHDPSTAPSSQPSTPTPHLHFGENYAQELQEKARLLPRTIRWHFIGALQTNKCKALARDVANLECVSSVDSAKKADELDKGRAACCEAWEAQEEKDEQGTRGEHPGPLHVHVQVNTSGEDSKSGVAPADAAALCAHIRDRCPHLRLRGFMTIGAIARSQAATPESENEDFQVLRETRERVAGELGAGKEELELSMGMSADFEAAIKQGADEVRVGSTIFGARPPRKEARVLEEVQEEKG